MSAEDLLAAHLASMGSINQRGIDQASRWSAIQTKLMVGQSVEAAAEINESLDELAAESNPEKPDATV